MTDSLPRQMRALQIDRYIDDPLESLRGLQVVTRDLPRPGPGQVLVRIEAAPCNPSDLMFLRGRYGVKKTLPAVPGWEGAGTVVASGGGLLGHWLKGRRVACAGQEDRGGTWAEYFLTRAAMCIPLDRDLTWEQGATLTVNPLAVLGLLDTARQHRAGVQTAAASQVGRMLVRLAAREDYPLIHIVRRDEQIAELKGLGAEVVLNSEADDFDERFAAACQELGATVLLDAVAGELTGRLLNLMPHDSKAVVYGALAGSGCGGISPGGLIFQGKRLEGFWLGPWLKGQGLLRMIRLTRRVQQLVREGVLGGEIRLNLSLEEAPQGLLDDQQQGSGGKVLIRPWQDGGRRAGQ